MSKQTEKKEKRVFLWERIENEIRITVWPAPKKAGAKLLQVTAVSCILIAIVLAMDAGFTSLIAQFL